MQEDLFNGFWILRNDCLLIVITPGTGISKLESDFQQEAI